jgi:hypothetical protein
MTAPGAGVMVGCGIARHLTLAGEYIIEGPWLSANIGDLERRGAGSARSAESLPQAPSPERPAITPTPIRSSKLTPGLGHS